MDLEAFPDIAIVGNSHALLEEQRGSEIDAHRYVARFNNFSLPEDKLLSIGSKVNIYVTSFYLDIKVRKNVQQFEKVYCPYPIHESKYRDKYPVNQKMVDDFRPEIIPTSIYEELIEFIPKPSTGITFLFWLYKEYSMLKEDSVYGFSFFKGKMHYFDEATFTTHKGDMEQDLFNKMIRRQI